MQRRGSVGPGIMATASWPSSENIVVRLSLMMLVQEAELGVCVCATNCSCSWTIHLASGLCDHTPGSHHILKASIKIVGQNGTMRPWFLQDSPAGVMALTVALVTNMLWVSPPTPHATPRQHLQRVARHTHRGSKHALLVSERHPRTCVCLCPRSTAAALNAACGACAHYAAAASPAACWCWRCWR